MGLRWVLTLHDGPQEFLGFGGARALPLGRGGTDPSGCRDVESDRLALGVVVDEEARRRLRYPCRPFGSASREAEIGSDRPPLAERHLEVPTSHDLLLLTTG